MGREKKRKEKSKWKNKYRWGGRNAWFYAQQPLIISDCTIQRNGMQRNKQKYESAYHYINDTIKN